MTSTREQLTDLLARVEGATGADREIDVALFRAAGPTVLIQEDYTASLDAALALLGRVLPGWVWEVSSGRSGLPWAVLSGDGRSAGGEAKTPALSILSAMLRALIAENPDDR